MLIFKVRLKITLRYPSARTPREDRGATGQAQCSEGTQGAVRQQPREPKCHDLGSESTV